MCLMRSLLLVLVARLGDRSEVVAAQEITNACWMYRKQVKLTT